MKGEREPSYRVVLQNEGGDFELGAAWRKTSDRGVAYLSVVLDDPAFPGRCDAALFTEADRKTARFMWQRPKPMQAPVPRPQGGASRPAAKKSTSRVAASPSV
jgi:uncharacterized protein (DUF736 family)